MTGNEGALPGLSDRDAANRLRQDGYNELPARRRRTVFHTVFELMQEPMFVLLVPDGAVAVATE